MDAYLLIDQKRIDVDTTIPFSASYSLADIQDPSKRKRNQTKTINIPATRNNIKFFQSAYSLTWTTSNGQTSGASYDATKSYSCEYYKGGNLAFRGFIQLLSVKLNKGTAQFEMVMFSDVSSMFQEFGDMLVGELGWSEYDHILTHTNMANSWDTSVKVNGVDTSNFTSGKPDGFGYCYGLIDYGFSTNQVDYDDNTLFPSIYQREIVTKAFDILGYTIDSNFIDSDFFRSLKLSIGGGELIGLDSTTVANLEVDFTGDGSRTKTIPMVNDWVSLNPSFPVPNDYIAKGGVVNNYWLTENVNNDFTTTTVTDFYGQEDTGVIATPITAKYRVNLSFDLDVVASLSGTGTKSVETIISVLVSRNGVLNTLDLVEYDGELNTTLNYNSTFEMDLVAGDEYFFRLFYQSNAEIYSPTEDYGDFTFSLDFNNTFNAVQTCISGAVVNGSPIALINYIPKMKVSDYLKAIITHYNLYISEPDAENIIKIEPLENYYITNSNYDTWTYKQDLDKNIEIEPILIGQPKIYSYEFAQDKDYYKQLHFDTYGVQYGDYQYTNPAFFANGESKFTLPYSVTPSVQIDGTNLIIPRIINVENGVIKPFKGKARVYIHTGMRTGNFTLKGTNGASDTSYTSYPCFSHLDNVDTPTFDLSFGAPSRYYFNASNFTTNDVFTAYYSRFINEVTSPDSKMLKTYIRLNPNDVQGDFLRKVKMIDGVLYRVNLIRDYNLNKDESVYCELIKIIQVKSGRQFSKPNYAPFEDVFAPETVDDFQSGFNNIEATNSVFINENKQMTASDGTSIDGDLIISGDWIIT